MKISLISALSVAMLLSASNSRADAMLESGELLGYFSAGCNSKGAWTDAALGYANNLVAVLKTMAIDPDCTSLSGALSVNAQSLAGTISSLNEDQNQKILKSLKDQAQQYLAFIAETTDPQKTGQLVNSLQSVEIQIAQYKSYQSTDQNYLDLQKQGRTLNTLVSDTRALLTQARGNEICLKKNKGLLTGIAGLASSVGAVVSTGGASLVAATGADLMNNLIENGRIHKINRRINKMSSAVTGEAFRCVLETLSNQWCGAMEAQDELNLVDNSITAKDPAQIEVATRLLITDTPKFLKWLNSIRAGSEPTNVSTATEQDQVHLRYYQVQAARVNGLGILAKTALLFDATKNDPALNDPNQKADALWTIEQKLISDIVTKLLGNNENPFSQSNQTSSPLGDIYGSNAEIVAQWGLIGVSRNSIPFNSVAGQYDRFSTFTLSKLRASGVVSQNFYPDLTLVHDQLLIWVGKAEDRVNREITTTDNPDPILLITTAKTLSLNGESAYTSLLKLIDYFQTNQTQIAASVSYPQIYKDMILGLKNIACNINLVADKTRDGSLTSETLARQDALLIDCDKILQRDTPNASPDARKVLENIYKAGNLNNGTGFIHDRIQWALRLSLNELILSPNAGGASAKQAAILLAQSDFVSDLESYENKAAHYRIAGDMATSRDIIQNTLTNFSNEFSDGIYLALTGYMDRGNPQELSKFCALLLAAPEWPYSVPKQFCLNVKIESQFQGLAPLTITQEILEAPFKDRICTSRNFDRKNNLFQYFHGKRSDGMSK